MVGLLFNALGIDVAKLPLKAIVIGIGLAATLLVASHLWVYFEGKESCTESAVRALTKEVAAAEKRGAEGARQAAKDAEKVSTTRSKLDELVKEAEKLSADGGCAATDEQLRLLNEIQRETATK